MTHLTAEQIAAIAAAAASTDDQTEATAGYEYTPPAEGNTAMRFIEYIETGMQKQKPHKGTPKPDAKEVRITFELLTNNKSRQDVRTVKKDDGTEFEVADRITIKTTVKTGEKALFFKLMKKMVYGRPGIVHMTQMLGEVFLGTVHHSKSEDGKRTYANLRDDDGNWTVRAPRIQTDPMDEGSWKDITARPAVSPLKVFVFDHATKETWDSLFIDGTRTVKDDKGVEREVSKNWLQEHILGATNYRGSVLEGILNSTSGLSLESGTSDGGLDDGLDDLPTDNGGVHRGASASDLSALGLDDDIPF